MSDTPSQVESGEPDSISILILSGIYPPDIGGPATHAADVRGELVERGHRVEVLSLIDGASVRSEDGIVRLPRRWPWPLRTLAALGRVVLDRRRFDVIYATGLGPVAVAGGKFSRRPVVLKIVGDPAWERSVRRGLTSESFDDFQASRASSSAVRCMQFVRNWSVRNATIVVTPSRHLADVVKLWAKRNDVLVIPNGVRAIATPKHNDRGKHALDLIFVGRLVAHKNVDVLVEAVANVSETRLAVIGDGPERPRLTRMISDSGAEDRISLVGALPHDGVMDRLRASDALVLASGYEGLPHVVLEALASGVPVVTAATHGLGELIADGDDGLLVPTITPDAYSDAFARLAENPDLLDRLRTGAARSGLEWSVTRTVDQLEELLREAAGATGAGPASSSRSGRRR